eukprot:3527895-Lingulodinium_polyedra.AAC.2
MDAWTPGQGHQEHQVRCATHPPMQRMLAQYFMPPESGPARGQRPRPCTQGHETPVAAGL